MLDPRSAPNRQALPEQTIHVIQGEYALHSSPNVLLSTVLGSCVSACLFDEQAGIGGMNHFLLPEQSGARGDVSFAAAAMEQLLNALLKQGAQKSRLRCKLFGGARMTAALPDIGKRNGLAAKTFLDTEAIPCLSESLGGDHARRVRFWPQSGRAQMLLLGRNTHDPAIRATKSTGGAVELF